MLKTSWIELRSKYYGVKYLLIFLALAMQFTITEYYVVPKYQIASSLDAFIPFVPAFVIPYTLWFFYIAAGLLYLMFTDQKLFVKTQFYLYVGYQIALIVYWLFPHEQLLRPAVTDIPDNIFGDLIRNLYETDTNTNCFPSIHVLNQLAIHFGLCHSKLFREHKWVKYLSFAFLVSVCASTCFIKQHSVLDVLAAFPLSFGCYWLVFRVDWGKVKHRFVKPTPSQDN